MRRKLHAAALTMIVGVSIGSSAIAGAADVANEGLDALKNGDYQRAVTLFTRAINSGGLSHDDKEFAYFERGTAYLKLGNKTSAATDFRRALKLKPDDQDAQAGLDEARAGAPPAESGEERDEGGAAGAEHAAEAGMEALKAGNTARAIQLFTRAIGGLSGDDKELALLSRGKAYAQAGEYAEAVADLNRALHMKPDDQDAQAAFGDALGHLHPRTPVDGIDAATCTKNFTTIGSVFTGKTYSSFAEYPTLSTTDAFAGVYNSIALYTPVPGMNWQVSAADLDAGTISAAITFADTGRAIKLDVRIEARDGGSKVTMTETVPALLPTIDLKGAICATLAGAAKG